MNSAEREAYERIASLVQQGISMSEIATAINLSETVLKSICETEEFKEILAAKKLEDLEAQAEVEDSWDTAEQKALGVIVKELDEMSVDPQFALKVAQVANSAKRRKFQTANVEVKPALQTVIVLQPTFAKKLENNFEISERNFASVPKKVTNILNIADAKKLLNANIENQNAIKLSSSMEDEIKNLSLAATSTSGD
jgi:hypothetical protein